MAPTAAHPRAPLPPPATTPIRRQIMAIGRKIVDESGAEVTPTRPQAVQAVDTGAVLAMAVALLDQVPDVPDSDGSEITMRMLEAKTWEDLNMSGKLPDTESIAGRALKVLTVGKRPSDKSEGLPFYLVIDSIDTDTGEVIRWQTSSQGVVFPLAKLAAWGKLPALVRVVKADKPTRGGYYPFNLVIRAVNFTEG